MRISGRNKVARIWGLGRNRRKWIVNVVSAWRNENGEFYGLLQRLSKGNILVIKEIEYRLCEEHKMDHEWSYHNHKCINKSDEIEVLMIWWVSWSRYQIFFKFIFSLKIKHYILLLKYFNASSFSILSQQVQFRKFHLLTHSTHDPHPKSFVLVFKDNFNLKGAQMCFSSRIKTFSAKLTITSWIL